MTDEAPGTNQPIDSFDDFFLYYLREHRDPRCRALHYVGTSLSIGCLAALVATGNWAWLLAGLISGYGFAWIGHFFVEKNRPATFKYPLRSLVSDYRMYGLWLTGGLKSWLRRAGVEPA